MEHHQTESRLENRVVHINDKVHIDHLEHIANLLASNGVTLHKMMRIMNIITNSSTRDIAKRCNLSLSMVNESMRGRKKITVRLQNAICQQYEIDIVQIFNHYNEIGTSS